MIPLISILNIVNFVVPILISARTYRAYRTSRSRLLLYFSLASFFFSFYWLFGSSPGIIFTDLYDIGVVNVLRFVFLYMTLIFIVQIPFSLITYKFLGLLFSFLVVVGGILFVSVGFLQLSPAKMVITSPFVYWVPVFPRWIETMTGVFSSVALSVFVAVFSYLAWRDWPHAMLRRRSLMIITGMWVMLIGGIFRFLIGGILDFYFTYGISTIFVTIGLLIISDGIMHEHKHATQQPRDIYESQIPA